MLNGDIYYKVTMTPEETIQVLKIKLKIAQENLSIADSEETRKNLLLRVEKLKYQLEIAEIKRKIEQLS